MRRGSSILSDVMGPVMRGPSSSHTAGPFFIGKAVREILGGALTSARVVFDPNGSFARVYRDQRSDVGFAAGLLGFSITEPSFNDSLSLAKDAGIAISFAVEPFTDSDSHPNAVAIEAASGGCRLKVHAASTGGGQIRVERVDDIPVDHDGSQPCLLVAGTKPHPDAIPNDKDPSGESWLMFGSAGSLRRIAADLNKVGRQAHLMPAIALIRHRIPSVYLESVEAIVDATAESAKTLSDLGREYEAQLLGLTDSDITAHMAERWDVMKQSAQQGLRSHDARMRFLEPSAAKMHAAIGRRELVCGGLLAHASAAAVAVMEVNSSHGVVCAAPTAGSAGIIPGLLCAIQQARGLRDEEVITALFAMAVVGGLVATRATFAAEVCGCAAETGVAAAMAAAGLVELARGTVRESLDAAALCLMNTLGLVCDPVQGAVEIPCHARNIAGVAHALAAADAILAGFRAVLPLDEVIDATLAVGRQMPSALRCTSLGGLATTPAALKLVALHPVGATS